MASEARVDNGVNVEALLAAREALSKAPEAANFKWRASCTWKNGTHSHSKVESFYGLGGEQKHRTTFTFDADHPEVFASEDNGATPVELVLVGLASCLTAGVAAVAQNRGIQLRSVTANLEGFKPDEAFQINDSESVPFCFELLRDEGLCLGTSSGVNVAGAYHLARALGRGHVIVTLLCDYGTRYASKLYNPEFLRSKGLPVPEWLENKK